MSTLSERLREATRDVVTGERLLPGLFGHSPIEDLEAAADELDRLTARVAELEKHEYKFVCERLSSCWYYGNFKAETPNERDIEATMRNLGLWPTTEAAIVERAALEHKHD